MKKIELRGLQLEISLDSCFCFIILLWFFEPVYFKNFPSVDRMYVFARLFCSLTVLITAVIGICERKYTPSAFVWLALAMQCALFVSSVINRDATFQNWFDQVVAMLTLILFVDYIFKRNPRAALSSLLLIYELLLVSCLIIVVMYPKGLYNIGGTRRYWLLGHQNQNILYILPGIVVSLLYSFYDSENHNYKISKRTVLLIAVCIALSILSSSSTSFAGMFIFAVILLISLFRIRIKLSWGIFLSIVVFLIFVVLRLQAIFEVIISGVLNRDLTLSSRIFVWDKALMHISQHPIIGYGIEPAARAEARFGYLTPHNRYLYMLYIGGIVALLIFMAMMFLANKQLNKEENTRAFVVMGAYLCAFIIMAQFESYDANFTYIPFIMATNVTQIVDINRDELMPLYMRKKE